MSGDVQAGRMAHRREVGSRRRRRLSWPPPGASGIARERDANHWLVIQDQMAKTGKGKPCPLLAFHREK
jgi:hypothetical protein